MLRKIICEFKELWTGKCSPDCCYKPECDQTLSQIYAEIKKEIESERKKIPYRMRSTDGDVADENFNLALTLITKKLAKLCGRQVSDVDKYR